MDSATDKTLDALRDFMKQEKKIVTNDLKDIIKDIAKKGRYVFKWEYLKPLYAYELEQVMDNFLESFPPKNANGTDEEKVKELQNEIKSILKIFNNFTSAPFTIQRLSELIMQPRKHYKTCAKFFRGLCKNLLVVSTVEPEEADSNAVGHVESDIEESPAKKMRLDGGTEANMETANGTVSSDSNDCKTTHPDDQTITNGEVNDTEMNNEADKNSSSKENDKTPLETFEECWKQGDESSATAEAAQPEETQIEKSEECDTDDKKNLPADNEQGTAEKERGEEGTSETKEDAEKNPEQTVEQHVALKTDLSSIDTPL